MRVLRSALLLLWVALFCSVLSAQNTINVPGDVATIQAAINSAQFGDTVLVAPGTYFENLDFLGKAITVKSSGGAQVTIIDGSATTHVVQFKSGETRQAVLDGFTIRNGYDAFGQGPGIFILNSGPTIQNNIITGNTGCLVSAVYSHFASPVILNNTVSGNGQVSGGCSGGLGGGIYIVGELSAVSPTQVIGNTIANNGAINGSGGGIALFAAGHAVVRNNVMRGNYATSFGSFYAVNMNQEVIVGNLITDNNDGSVYLSVPAAATGITFLNNTIVTTGTNTGYGLDLAGFYGSSTVKNNLIIGTSAVTPLYCDTTYSSILPNATNNDVFSPAAASSYGGGCSSLMGTSSNGSFDPQFMDQAHGNYHLQIRSAAVDAGDNNAPALPVTDVDGNNRILDGNSDGNAVVDLGAYEFVPGQAPSGYAALSPASIGFGQVQTGTTSSAQTFLLTNTGTADLNIASVVASSPFVIAFNNCPSILSAGISCSVAVVFSPTSDGASSGTLTVTSDATNGAATATLSGTGVPAGPTISPNPINFGSVLVNSTSTQNVYVTNTSATTLTLRTIGFAPFYSGVPGGCSSGTVLAPGASCGMGIDFSPTRMGTLNGTVTITTTPPSMPSFASITGVAIAPVVNVDQTSLSFGTQHIGTTSAAQTVNVSNTGTAPLRIYSVGTSGAFAQTDNCGLSLAAGASCSITVTFSPTVRWAYTSNLSISSNSMQTATTTNIALTGTGTAPVLSLNPSSLTFSSQVIGTTSAPQSIPFQIRATPL